MKVVEIKNDNQKSEALEQAGFDNAALSLETSALETELPSKHKAPRKIHDGEFHRVERHSHIVTHKKRPIF